MLQTSTIDIINEINEGISRINSYASIALLQYHKNTGSNFEPPDTTIIDLCNKTCLRIDDMWTQAREDMFKGKHDNKIDEIGLIITKNFDRIIETINYCIQVGKILEKTNNISSEKKYLPFLKSSRDFFIVFQSGVGHSLRNLSLIICVAAFVNSKLSIKI